MLVEKRIESIERKLVASRDEVVWLIAELRKRIEYHDDLVRYCEMQNKDLAELRTRLAVEKQNRMKVVRNE